ncbi:MAG: 2-dehydro-3-deoxygluconokinase [Gammaproteobacteria bacterium]|jgi:2-dehydro-3-deoxygluconokinase
MGEPMVEFNEHSPGSFQLGFGGDTSNCAIAAARQGARVGYLTALGRDVFGDRLLALWAQENVDAQHVLRDEVHSTAHYFVTHGDDGHVFTYHRADSAASHMRADQLPQAYLRATKFLHVSAISQAISEPMRLSVLRAMELARATGARVAYDTNLRLQLWSLDRARQVIHDALAHCDIALPGYADAVALTGLNDADDIVDFYLALGPSIVALSLGADGVLVAHREQREHLTGHAVSVLDATAAGDTFDGAFLCQLAVGNDVFSAARYANAAAALSTTGYGAVAPMPTRAQTERFLASL